MSTVGYAGEPGNPLAIQLEQEIKFRMQSRDDGEAMLDGIGAILKEPRYFESNHLFDLPDGRFSMRREVLRLRRAGKEATLTYKGPLHGSGRIKKRHEFETHPVSRRVVDDQGLDGATGRFL